MNWGGTKWILIFVFFVLNLFLGYQLWQKTSAHPELVSGYEYTLDELLYLHHISLDTELDLREGHLAQLEVSSSLDLKEGQVPSDGQEVYIEDNVIRAVLSPPFKLGKEFDPRSFQDNFLSRYVYRGQDYRLHSNGGEVIHYLQYHGDLPLFISELDIFVNSDRQVVTGYRQVYLRILSEGLKQPIIPSHTGLRTLIDQQVIPPFATIIDVDLGYYGHSYNAEQQVLTPTWRIAFKDGGSVKEAYVNAYTGAIELEPGQTEEVKQDELALLHTGKRKHGERRLYPDGADAPSG